ncbi:MAG TPA: hypothetical protein PK280_15895 [Planctomycetota bacterium]|nr:hypothetical protein [Planctomycetota bacterium]
MPEFGQLPPTVGPGRPGPLERTARPEPQVPAGPDAVGFKARLAAKLAARKTRSEVPQEHLADIIRLCNERGEAFESVKLITKYPITERDDALYEVRTDRSLHRVIRSRDGAYTIF